MRNILLLISMLGLLPAGCGRTVSDTDTVSCDTFVYSVKGGDSLRLDLHGTEIRCYYFGGGHSEDNIAVWIPSAKLLFAGCMVKEMAAQNAGNLSDAVLAAWPATLDSLLVRFPDARIVVPGHGAPGGPELIRHTKALLSEAASTDNRRKE